MLKRISVQQLTLGMFLHEFCGPWLAHPFWRKQFLLDDPEDLARIRAAGMEEVWIDTSQGLDAAGEALAEAAPSPAPAPAPARPAQPPARRRSTAPVGMEQELRLAVTICAHAKAAVEAMFNEARMGRALDSGTARELVEEISDSVTRNPSALVSLARLKKADDYTYMHSVAVCALMVALARQMGMDEAAMRIAGMAGLLHDLGKATVPQEILNKPGKLTDEEFDVVRTHCAAGHALLQGAGVHPQVLDACLHHHEKMDGTGYPHRLKGEQISVLARMAAICDVYDAITSDRPYKRGWDPAEALRRMAEWVRSHLDERLFHAFVKSLGIYPVGALVRLASERIGVVTGQNEGALLTPQVKVFFSTRTGRRITPAIVDLASPRCQDKIVAREDPARWSFADVDELWSGLPRPR
ncbi:MAG: HD-GYP domain-containing protein [Acidovorax sp.]